MPACSGLLCPRPGKSKPNSAASAFSAASPSRRSAPPSISSSQRASQELLFQHVVTPRVAERQLHAGPCAGFAARRQIGDRLGAVALEKAARMAAATVLLPASLGPTNRFSRAAGRPAPGAGGTCGILPGRCATASLRASFGRCLALHPQQQPQRLGGNGGLRLVARRGLHRLQLRRDLGHVAAGASCAKSASSGSSSRPEKSQSSARACAAASPAARCSSSQPGMPTWPASSSFSTSSPRSGRTVGQRLGIGRQAQRLAPGRPAVAAQGHALDLRRRAGPAMRTSST